MQPDIQPAEHEKTFDRFVIDILEIYQVSMVKNYSIKNP